MSKDNFFIICNDERSDASTPEPQPTEELEFKECSSCKTLFQPKPKSNGKPYLSCERCIRYASQFRNKNRPNIKKVMEGGRLVCSKQEMIDCINANPDKNFMLIQL